MKSDTRAWLTRFPIQVPGLLLLFGSMIACGVMPRDQMTEPPSVMYTPLPSAPFSPDPSYGQPEKYGDPAKAEEGYELHRQILDRCPETGEFYRNPFVWGAGTSTPLCCILVPINDWDSLPDGKKDLLAHYAASFVDRVKADPFRYMSILESSPVAPLLRANVQKMTVDGWGIVVGYIADGSRDIRSAHIAKSGITEITNPSL